MAIKINYKGTSSRGTNYLYRCPVCHHEQEENHPAAETPTIRCNKCQHCMNKKPTTLNLDAELHENGKSYNIGWDYDGSEE
jgi:peptide subunit release factor 1 (eRF1)